MSSTSNTVIKTPSCTGSSENSVRQGTWGSYVNVANSVQRGWVHMCVFGSWGNWITELRDLQLRPVATLARVSYSRWVFQVMLWAAVSSFPSLLAQNRETLCPGGSVSHLAGRFLKRWFAPSCYIFSMKWHSGSLKMANNPLWVNANQASQLALRTSSLKARA